MKPRRATKGEWAELLARKQYGPNDGGPLDRIALHYAEGRKDEHARAVRIVKAKMARVTRDEYSFTQDQKSAVLGMLEVLLAAIQRGR